MYLPVGFIPVGVSSVWEEELAVGHAVDKEIKLNFKGGLFILNLNAMF